MIYEDKTEKIRRGLFAVQNEVGLGRGEELYHQAFCSWLTDQGIPHASKKPHPIMLQGETVHVLFPDVVAWDAITIELKALTRRMRDEDRVQIFNYLKMRNDKLGLLVNMGLDHVHDERIVYDRPIYALSENWDSWPGETPELVKQSCHCLRGLLLDIYQEHQTGYGVEVAQRLFTFGLQRRGLALTVTPQGASVYRGRVLGESPLECMIVEKELLITFTALFDGNTFNIHRGRSFMKALGLHWGVAINFGKQEMEINGIYV